MAFVQAIACVVGRLCLCTIFLMAAVGKKIPEFKSTAATMENVGIPMPNIMLVGAIVFLLAGSVSVIVGFKARIGAVLLMVFLALATYYFHDFWNDKPKEMIAFMKNLSMFGAFLFIVGNGAGLGSIDRLLVKRSQA